MPFTLVFAAWSVVSFLILVMTNQSLPAVGAFFSWTTILLVMATGLVLVFEAMGFLAGAAHFVFGRRPR